MHSTKQCLHAHERQKSGVFPIVATGGDYCDEEECIEVRLCTACGAYRNNHNHRLLEEIAWKALDDSGCHRTVYCERWLLSFDPSFSDNERRSTYLEDSFAIHCFDDCKQKKEFRCVTFPPRFGGK